MGTWTVNEVIDGDTFVVSPGWTWGREVGDRVRPVGYDAPEIGEPGGWEAKRRLRELIDGKQVQLGSAYRVDRGRLVALVFLNGMDLAEFFSRFQ